ncbi:MAG: DUF86 domain-containing protein [Bacteroidota bacterium]
MVDRDVVQAKIAIIQRCLKRIKNVTGLDPTRLDDLDTQDIFALNLQRAVQATIDLAAHVVGAEGLGVPQDLRENFRLLVNNRIISQDLCARMEKMVGFRNIAVHEYRTLDIEVLKSILKNNLKDLEDFYTALIKHFGV